MPYADRERRLAYQKKYQKVYYLRRKESYRWYGVKNKHGISKEEWLIIYNQQLGLCAVCEKHILPYPSVDSQIDHDHRISKIRGILCNGCNIAVGFFETHNTEAIRRYLRRKN